MSTRKFFTFWILFWVFSVKKPSVFETLGQNRIICHEFQKKSQKFDLKKSYFLKHYWRLYVVMNFVVGRTQFPAKVSAEFLVSIPQSMGSNFCKGIWLFNLGFCSLHQNQDSPKMRKNAISIDFLIFRQPVSKILAWLLPSSLQSNFSYL